MTYVWTMAAGVCVVAGVWLVSSLEMGIRLIAGFAAFGAAGVCFP